MRFGVSLINLSQSLWLFEDFFIYILWREYSLQCVYRVFVGWLWDWDLATCPDSSVTLIWALEYVHPISQRPLKINADYTHLLLGIEGFSKHTYILPVHKVFVWDYTTYWTGIDVQYDINVIQTITFNCWPPAWLPSFFSFFLPSAEMHTFGVNFTLDALSLHD